MATTKTKRFEIRTEDDFLTQLESLAVASGVSKSEVIHRAIGLYTRALMEAEQGKTIQFVEAADNQ
jgi:hypothetical protein